MELSGFRNNIVHDNINEYPRNRGYDDFMMDDLKQSRRASFMERSRTTIERDFAQSQSDAKKTLSGENSIAAAPEKCKCFYSTKLVLKIFISVLVFTNLLTAAVVGGGVHLYYDKHSQASNCPHEVEETKHLYGDNPVYGRSHLYGETPSYGTQRVGNSPPYRRPIKQNPRYRKQQISVNPTYTKQPVVEKPNYKTYRILLRPPTVNNDTSEGPKNDTSVGPNNRSRVGHPPDTLKNDVKKIVARSQVADNATLETLNTIEPTTNNKMEDFHNDTNIREPKKLLPKDHLSHNSTFPTRTTTISSLSSTKASSVAAALVAKQSAAELLCDATNFGQEIVQCCSEGQEDKSTCNKAIVIQHNQRFQLLELHEKCLLRDNNNTINNIESDTIILLATIAVLVLSIFLCVLFLQRNRCRNMCSCGKVQE